MQFRPSQKQSVVTGWRQQEWPWKGGDILPSRRRGGWERPGDALHTGVGAGSTEPYTQYVRRLLCKSYSSKKTPQAKDGRWIFKTVQRFVCAAFFLESSIRLSLERPLSGGRHLCHFVVDQALSSLVPGAQHTRNKHLQDRFAKRSCYQK